MKKNIYTLTILFFLSSALSAQMFQWTNTGGGPDLDESYSAALDTSGSVFITGLFSTSAFIANTSLVSTGGTDMFFSKYTPAGISNWVRTASGYGNAGGHVLATDQPGNIYVAGEFEDTIFFGATQLISAGLSDIFLAKYDNTGIFLWAIRGGGTGLDAVSGIKTDASGNVFLTGHFENTFTLGIPNVVSAGGKDLYVAKLNTSGTVIWLTRAGGASDDESRAIVLNSSSINIAGHFDGNATFGSTNLTNNSGDKDVFVAQLNSSGIFQWAVRAGGNGGTDDAYDATMDNAGNIYVAGYFHDTATFGAFTLFSHGNDDAFIAKYSSTGTVQWVVQAGDTLGDRAYDISSNAAGTFVVTGSFEDTVSFGATSLISSGDKDIFVAEYNTSGIVQWAVRAGGAGFDRGYGIVNDNSGNVYVTGIYEQSATFGSDLLTSAGLRDLFLSKISSLTAVPLINSEENTFQIYPNPVGNELYVISYTPAPTHSGLYGVSVSFELYSVMGKKIISKTLTDKKSVIDLSEFANGIYFYKITFDNNRIRTGKIIKQ